MNGPPAVPDVPMIRPSAEPGSVASRPLRNALVAPPWYELPPVSYGGIEAVVASLVDELADRGHHVTLIAAGENRTRAARFVPVFPEPPSERIGTSMPEVLHAAAVGQLLPSLDVDIIHDHSLAGPLLAAGRSTPTVVTMHGPVTGEHGQYLRLLGDSIDVVAISHSQMGLNSSLNWVGCVHNAIDVASFPFCDQKDDYVLWLGRFHPDKGPGLAIDAARKAGVRIVLAGKCTEPCEKDFFETEIAGRLGPDAEYVGEADATLKRELLCRARALAFPLQWEEPFGMVMIEAMACGTPVVALRRGSVPEVVADGVAGHVVDDYDDFPAALHHAADLDPAACREHVEQHFNLSVMAAGYEHVYRTVVERTQSHSDLGDVPAMRPTHPRRPDLPRRQRLAPDSLTRV